jgi:hypothetical protein
MKTRLQKSVNIYAIAGVKPDKRDLALLKRFDLRFNTKYLSSNLNILFKNPFIYFKQQYSIHVKY